MSQLNEPRTALNHYPPPARDACRTHERAFSRAVALYEKLGDYPACSSSLQARTAATDEPSARAELPAPVKPSCCATGIGDARGAVAALQTSGRSAAARSRLATSCWRRCSSNCAGGRTRRSTYRTISELVPGDETSRKARMKEAEIRERELGDREAARLILEELVVDPTDEQAARYMAQLCERMGRWDRARELWLQLARTREPPARADALLSLAFVLEDGFDDREVAARAFDEAFAIAAQRSRRRRASIEQRFKDGGDWRDLLHRRRARLVARARRRGAGEVAAAAGARVYQDELHRPDLAQNHLGVAIGLSPDDPAAERALGAAASRQWAPRSGAARISPRARDFAAARRGAARHGRRLHPHRHRRRGPFPRRGGGL